MKEAILPFLEYALEAPETTLGTVERNTEIKVACFTLVALGWEPMRDVALGFCIERAKLEGGARAANAVDFCLRDAKGIWVSVS